MEKKIHDEMETGLRLGFIGLSASNVCGLYLGSPHKKDGRILGCALGSPFCGHDQVSVGK